MGKTYRSPYAEDSWGKKKTKKNRNSDKRLLMQGRFEDLPDYVNNRGA